MLRALERVEAAGRGDSPLHRIDARWKILVAILFVFVLALVPLDQWRLMIVLSVGLAFLIGLSGVSSRLLVGRWLALFPVVVCLALVISPGHPAAARMGVWPVGFSLVARNAIAVMAILLLAHTTTPGRLIAGLGRLGIPTIVLSTIQIMMRYIYVLADQFDRMIQARRSRTFRRSTLLDWRIGSGLISSLLLRSIERGERVHSAMLARGFDGRVRSLDERYEQ
jgi:cobalt/nickel transport system permease protein